MIPIRRGGGGGRTSASWVTATPSSRRSHRTARGRRRRRSPATDPATGDLDCSVLSITIPRPTPSAPAALDGRLERGLDLREEAAHVGPDQAEERDRHDRDQAEDHRVLDERLALLAATAAGKAT